MKGGIDVYRTPFGADGTGMVDCIAVKNDVCLFIENKSENGKASPEQMKWLLALSKVKALKALVLTPLTAMEILNKSGVDICL
jgi:Holliday junction resolvase